MKLKKQNYFKLLTIFLVTIFLTSFIYSCTTSYLTTWKNPNYKGGPFNKIGIIGLVKELRMQKSLEYDFAKMLKSKGIDAVASLDFLSPDKKYTREEIEEQLAKYNVDGILIFELLGVDKETQYVPTTYYYDYYYGWWGWQSGGYLTSTTNVKFQTSLYANSDDTLVWTGQSDTYNPANTADIVNSLGPKIIESLEKEGLIK